MRKIIITFCLLCTVLLVDASSQVRKPPRKQVAEKNARESRVFVVIDERLSVIREKPSLYAIPLQRMRRGRLILISGGFRQDENGIKFYPVQLPNVQGWVQAEALAAVKSKADEKRLISLIQDSSGFDKIERTAIFLKYYPDSEFYPTVLLLFGDLLEEVAATLSRDAKRRLDEKEMAASGAPIESFYLSYSGLDRYRRLGVTFLFNKKTRNFHYDGQAWKEIIEKFPNSSEVAEAKKRLDALKAKMQEEK